MQRYTEGVTLQIRRRLSYDRWSVCNPIRTQVGRSRITTRRIRLCQLFRRVL
jgi:hypothetical protein